MATVTGLTAERMIEMENATVIDGDVVGNDLVLKTRDGTQINAGNVRGPQGIQGAQGDGFIVCTSTTRPVLTVMDEGKAIYETDTDLVRIWVGNRWKLQEHIICASTTRPAVIAADEGINIYETDTNLTRTWNGSRWVVQERITCTSTSRPALAANDEGVVIYETDTNLEFIWDGAAWVFNSPFGRRIASDISPGKDQLQGMSVLMNVTFNLPVSRLMKIEAYAVYTHVSANSNSSTYFNAGFDLGRQVQMGLEYNVPTTQSKNCFCAYYTQLAAGSHTAEVHTISNSTVGAMRIGVGDKAAWMSVIDMGP